MATARALPLPLRRVTSLPLPSLARTRVPVPVTCTLETEQPEGLWGLLALRGRGRDSGQSAQRKSSTHASSARLTRRGRE